MRAIPVLIACGLAVAGCTATLSTVRIVAADKAIDEAEALGAPTRAPYEYTLATQYRAKAWEQFADGQHGDAVSLANLAATTARLAVTRMDTAGRPAGPALDPEALPDPAPRTEPDTVVGDTDPLGDAFRDADPPDEPAPWEPHP